MRGVVNVACMGEMRTPHKVLLGIPEGKSPLGRYKDVIRLDLRGTGWKGVNLIRVAEDRDQWLTTVILVMNVWAL
jgi:hypothetical protein